ncbi:hypothetical protein [Halomarina oriensis]|uniref:Uncharacterized protein n=1 Tax=Halomarina oriensis TaxID=671145 RepID=A0A6B0GNE9_9EURY|nr:hypothetical protein [Halomarina oriensis]MWG33108.1 hypothetical protein [Halomarina oriensis]
MTLLDVFLATLLYLATVSLLALLLARTRVRFDRRARTFLSIYVAPAAAVWAVAVSLYART